MFISIVLNTEYWDYNSRSKWYLKNVLHSKENGWILITHEYLGKHFEEIQKDITPRLFNDFEMRPFSAEEVSDVEQYFLSDELFEQIEKDCGSRTEYLWYMANNRCEKLEICLQDIIDTIRLKHPSEKIDGIFNCLESWESIRYVALSEKIPLVSYVFSALRKPHGYRQTLYSASYNFLYSSVECEKRWQNFNDESVEMPIFSNRELVALLGKERTLPLIPLMHFIPKYEINVCGEGFVILPHIFSHNPYCDEDIYYECGKLYTDSQMQNRQHPTHMNALQLSRDAIHNDPAAWILGAKRTVATCSQIVLKAALWNRTPIMPKNTLPFSFMCSKSFKDTKKMDIKFLNYYIFCSLIPNDLMFSDEYWKWRMTHPSEFEIYQRHLDFMIENLHLPKSILTEHDEKKRFKNILGSRSCDKELVKILLEDNHDFDIDYNTAISRIVVNNKSYWRLNKLENGVRHFHIELDESTESIEFYPLDDVAGCVKLVNASANGSPVDVSQFVEFKYVPKVTGHYTLPIPNNDNHISIDIEWDYQSNNDFLNQNSLK